MLPAGWWRRELLEVGSRKAAFARDMAAILAVGFPILFGPLRPSEAAGLLTALMALSAAITSGFRAHQLVRDGLIERYLGAPVSPYRLFLEAVGVQAGLDLLRILPLLLLLIVRYHPAAPAMATLGLATVFAITFADLCGVLAGVLAPTTGETPVFAVVTVLPPLFLAGVFTPQVRLAGERAALAALLPYSHLHQALMASMGSVSAWPLVDLVRGAIFSSVAWVAVAVLILRRRLASM